MNNGFGCQAPKPIITWLTEQPGHPPIMFSGTGVNTSTNTIRAKIAIIRLRLSNGVIWSSGSA
jgi:hypothetical protein